MNFVYTFAAALAAVGDGANVAVGKPTNQTGAWEPHDGSGAMTSDRAVDGAYYNGTPENCAALKIPLGRPAEWWVDLLHLYNIRSATIYNTGDPGGYERLNNISVYVGSPGQPPVTCGKYTDVVGLGAHITLNCAHHTVGQYVGLVREGGGPTPYYVPICEVEVNAQLYYGCLIGYYGELCHKQCGHCAASDDMYNTCNKNDGYCLNGCQVGYTGHRCNSLIDDVNTRTVLVPWVLFAISCIVTTLLCARLLYKDKRKMCVSCNQCNEHSYYRASDQLVTNSYDVEMQHSATRTGVDPGYKQLQEETVNSSSGSAPYDIVL